VAREGRRTTIVAKDVIGALKELDFEDFIPAMEKFLEGHRKDELSKKEEKERLKEKKKGGKEGGSGDGDDYAERDSTGKFASMKKEERNENYNDENEDSTLEQAYGKDWKKILSYDKSDDGDDQEEEDDEKIMAAGGEEKKHARDHDNDHDEGDDDDEAGGGESASKKRKIETDEE
jgi:DNA polymerase epsilon subunit 3